MSASRAAESTAPQRIVLDDVPTIVALLDLQERVNARIASTSDVAAEATA